MSPQEFCYWLQGLLELQPDLKTSNEVQVQMIRDHLGYVCTHVQANKKPVSFVPPDIGRVFGAAPVDGLSTIAIC